VAGLMGSQGFAKVISNIEPLAIDDDLLYLGELTAILYYCMHIVISPGFSLREHRSM